MYSKKQLFNFVDVKKPKIEMSNNNHFKSKLIGLQGNLMSFAYKLTLNRDEANDLVQDTTLKALDNEEKYVENVNFKGWIFTIMRNIFINNYRRSVRENTITDETDNQFLLNSISPTTDETPDGAYATTEISSIIAKMQPDFSRPFSMHVAGYKYEEIAQKLGMPIGTVKSRIFTTRQQLREMLKDYR